MGRSRSRKALSVVLALAVWQLGAMALGQSILLVTPVAVAGELIHLLPQAAFWQAVWFSFVRILSGFFLALALGVALAGLSYRFPPVETLLWPYITVMKSTPVASFIILVLIWLNAASLSIFVSFLIVLPVIYSNVFQGLASTDAGLLEMARVFRLGLGRRTRFIYLPQLRPHLISACGVSIGMAWKSGIAAEVIGIPGGSIGERLYQAKIYFSSRELFAWTVVVIVVSVVFEKLFIRGLRAMYRRMERG